MTQVMNTPKATITDQFKAFEQSLNGRADSVFHTKRQEALQSFTKAGFPHKKHEEYKYLNLREVIRTDFDLPSQPNVESIPAEEFFIPELESNTLVFIDGHYAASHSNIIDSGSMTIGNIQDAPESIFEEYFGDYGFGEYNPFSALNIAFATQGAFIHIPKGCVLENPVQIVNINTGQQWVQPHHLVLVEEQAQVNIIENYFSFSDKGLDNTFLRIIAKENAHVQHYKLQALGEKSNHFGTTHIQQMSQSVCTTHVYNLSGGLVRNNIRIDIEDERTEANMYGLYLPTGKEVVDNHTVVNHKVSNCLSNQLYKGIVDDESTAIFNGKIYVQRDAQQTNAFQSNRNITNSDDATINTKPQLEIWADDVKCSHGATIGKLNPQEIFYLRSRGIDEKKAKAMLTYAFAGEVLSYVKIPTLRSFIEEGVAAKLGFELS